MNKRISCGHRLIVAALIINVITSYPTLGQTKETRDVNSLIAALKNNDWRVRENAVRALVEVGASAVEPLIAVLKDQDRFVRQGAANALGKIKDVRAVEPLIAALEDHNSDVRWRAAEALGQIKDARAVEPLIAALKDRHSTVRGRAAEALGRLKDARAVEPLIAALKDGDSYVRRCAAEALGQLKDARAVEPLIAALKDGDSDVRGGAAEALGQIKDARPVETLTALLDDNESRVRIFAVKIQTDQKVLAKIALTGKYPDSREIAVGKVDDQIVLTKVASEDKFANVRKAAVGKLTDQMLLARITIEDRDSEVRQDAERRVDPEVLRKVKQDIAAAIASLANISDPNQLVQIAVTDSWRDVRKAAVERLGDQVALARAVNKSKDWDVVKLAFNKITDTSVLTKLAEGTTDRAVRLAIQVREGRENWKNAVQKAAQEELTTGDVIGAIALLPQDNAVAGVADELCLAYIRKGDILRVPELIELLNLYGTETLAEDYLNCGQGDLDSAAREWAYKHGYNISIGSGSHRASWGSQKY